MHSMKELFLRTSLSTHYSSNNVITVQRGYQEQEM